jgi:hypothetical protein
VWATVASALASRLTVQDADVAELTRAAAPYVTLDTEDGQSVYRLAHRTFVEHLVHQRPEHELAQHHHRITARLTDDAARHRSPDDSLNAYLVRHLASHAAKGAAWQVLAAQPHVLDHLDPASVTASALRAGFDMEDFPPEVTGVVVAQHLLASTDPCDRRGIRELAAAHYVQHPDEPFRPRWDGDDSAPWCVRWAQLAPRVFHLTLIGHTGAIHALIDLPGPGGDVLLASAGDEGTVRLWNPATGAPHGEPLAAAQEGAVTDLAVHGSLLASGARHGRVMVWDVSPYRPVPMLDVLHPEGGDITAISFLPGPHGKVWLAAAADGVVRVWDVATGTPVESRRRWSYGDIGQLVPLPSREEEPTLAVCTRGGAVHILNPLSEPGADGSTRARPGLPLWAGGGGDGEPIMLTGQGRSLAIRRLPSLELRRDRDTVWLAREPSCAHQYGRFRPDRGLTGAADRPRRLPVGASTAGTPFPRDSRTRLCSDAEPRARHLRERGRRNLREPVPRTLSDRLPRPR